MKIAYIVPGTGGAFYCENCVRDPSLLKALKEKGHDVVVVPMYLPLTAGEAPARSDTPVFFGAISTYLRQKYPVLRILPGAFLRAFDSPALLNWAAGKAGSVRASGLEEMTLSILLAEQGPHAAELDRLITWLAEQEKPDIVHLSNALLVGLARRFKEKLHVPVVCTLQDEDSWLDAMQEPLKQRVWETLAERARDVDEFISVSQYYSRVMVERMHLPPERVNVVYIGVDPDIFHPAQLLFRPPVIGFVSRISESMGLGVLIEAFVRLKTDSRLAKLRLRITGGHTDDDERFIAGVQRRLRDLHMQDDVDFILDFDTKTRLDFLQTLSVFTLPMPAAPAFGLPVLEAIASGVPVVQPDVGAFRELIEITEGGVLYDHGDMDQYTNALESLLLDPERARMTGRHGRDRAMRIFNMNRMATGTIGVYEQAQSRRTATK
jgi:glycosyltransferase involved in cell wall biosynthesis